MKIFLKHLLIASLIAVGLTIVYAIVAPIVITGMYSGQVILIGGAILFFGSFIFYFVFIFFKRIQKLPWLFGGITVYVGVVLLVNGFADVIFKNLFNNSSLPVQYAQYQDIKKPVIQFKNKTMKLVIDGHTDLEYYITAQNNLIVGKAEIDYKSNKETTYFKFDSLGNIIAKFKPSYAYETFFEGYLINESDNYYRTWALDGDTSKRKIDVNNGNLALNAVQRDEFITNIETNATFIFSKEGYAPNGERVKKILYRQNNNWNVFYNNIDDERKILNRGNSDNDLFRHYSARNYDMLPTNNGNIEYQYFQKIKLESSANNGGGTTKSWDGYLFSNLIIGADTLKIKEAVTMDEEWQTQQTKIKGETVGDLKRESQLGFLPYLYYSNPKLQYQLFTNHLGKLYIIRNK